MTDQHCTGSKRQKSYGSFDSGSFRKTNNHDEIESDSSCNSRAASRRDANRPNRQNLRDSNTSKRNNDYEIFQNESHRSNETAHRLKKSGMSLASNLNPLGDDDCWKTDGSLKGGFNISFSFKWLEVFFYREE